MKLSEMELKEKGSNITPHKWTMKKIFIHVDGNMFDAQKEFVKKLTGRGAKLVDSPAESDVTLLFCPIVSRFDADITSALTTTAALGCQDVILVVMHHTFNKNYIVPSHREPTDPRVLLMVQCLFFKGKGLLSCSRNKKAKETVREKLGLPTLFDFGLSKLKRDGK